jgi:SHS2 domain-containing protein
MTRGAPDYQILEHTADIGILVRGSDPEALFERCAAAMFDLMVDLDAVARDLSAGAVVDDFEVEAPDREALLVAWLGELLGRAMVDSVIYAAFELRRQSDTHLLGRAWGKPFELANQVFRTEIKAVTYHELLVSEDREGWTARVIFDI